jgi:hypothetical protein
MKLLQTVSLLLILSALPIAGQVAHDTTDSQGNTVYEKVYLHIDREFYSPRETIWFKVYVVSGINHKLLYGNKNIYVQLIDEGGKVVEDVLLLSEDGVTHGEFKLPYLIDEGMYTIRAYTKYHENFGEENYFYKNIWISRTKRREKNIEPGSLTESDIDVGFYPESGTLLQNSANMVAFKAVGVDGRGINISGSIVDENGRVITSFATSYLGMGSFILMPAEGKTYSAILDDFPDFRYTFDHVRAQGAIFSFIDYASEVSFLIGRNYLIEGSKTYYLSASHKGLELFHEKIISDNYQLEASFKKELLPLGVSKITLWDENSKILAERLVFIQADQAPLIQISTDKNSYSTRSKVVTSIKSLLPENDSLVAAPSVAVVNKDYLIDGGYSQDLRSYLLLDSELKGSVEYPASFFQDDHEISSSEKLNLLLMVQGWRRYAWDDIIARQPANHEGWEDIGITLKGHVKRLFRKNFIAHAKVEVSPFSAMWKFDEMYTDSLGRFRFDRLYIPDSSKIIIRAENEKGRNNTEIILDPVNLFTEFVSPEIIEMAVSDPEVPDEYYSVSFYKLEAEKRYAIESGSVWLDEVEVVMEVPEELDRSMGLYGFPDRTIELTDDDRIYSNIFEYLEVNPQAGVMVDGNSISIRGGGSPLYVVDGIIDEFEMFITMPLGDIDKIEIIKNSMGMAAYGSRGGNGIIAVYTRKGRINNTYKRYVRGRLEVDIEGFHLPEEFYSTKYNLLNINDEQPDYRPTLFWNPNLDMENNQAQFEYYSSDFMSDYAIIVEGITSRGKIWTGIKVFSVTKEHEE